MTHAGALPAAGEAAAAAEGRRFGRRAARAAVRWGFLLYLAGLVAIPMGALVVHALLAGPSAVLAALAAPQARAALRLSLSTALLVTALNSVAGLAVAWALVRWEVPGRRWVSRLVELPFAVPTLVAGVLVVALLGPTTFVGAQLAAAGVSLAFARPAIVLVLMFVTFPFVVRAVEPILAEVDPAEEEAARTLGASPAQTARWVVLPAILPAVGAGAVQVYARCVAEFGAVAVVSGNIPFETLTAPVYILGEVEAGDTQGAAAVSLALLLVAVALQGATRLLVKLGRHS